MLISHISNLPHALDGARFSELYAEISAYCKANGGPDLSPENVRTVILTDGRSDVVVMEASFQMQSESTLRFVLRIHGIDGRPDENLAAYRRELDTLRKLELVASKYVSREFLNAEFSLRLADDTSKPVTVLRHASDREGSEVTLRDFTAAVADLLNCDSAASVDTFENCINAARPELNKEWQKIPNHGLPQVVSGEELAVKTALATLPDYIVTIDQCSLRDNHLVLGDAAQEFQSTPFNLLTESIPLESLERLFGGQHDSDIASIQAKLSVVGRTEGEDIQYAQCVLKDGSSFGVAASGEARSTLVEASRIKSLGRIILPTRLLVPTKEALEHRSIPHDALITQKQLTGIFRHRAYHVLVASHADLHAGNVLANQNTLKVIDFYNPKFRPRSADWARLATSLIAGIESKLDETRKSELLACKNWPSEPIANKTVELLNRILGTLAGSRPADWEYERVLVFAIESSRFMRYIVEGVMAGSETFFEWCIFIHARLRTFVDGFDREQAGVPSATKTEKGIPPERRCYYDLWERSLKSQGLLGLTAGAKDTLRALAMLHESRISAELSELQRSYVEHLDSTEAANSHTLILGPTSTGKSTIAQAALMGHFINPIDVNRPCAIYIAPTKALTFAFFGELKAILLTAGLIKPHGNELIVSSGDDREYDHFLSQGRFKIACVVNEKANAIFSRSPYLLGRVGMLVVDELHMIQELQRGPVLETLLMKLHSEQARADRITTTQSRRNDTVVTPRLIGISTEQQRGEALRAFFTVKNDSGVVQPTVLRSTSRPVSVKHCFVFRDDGNDAEDAFRIAIEPIVEVSGDKTRRLEPKRLRAIAEKISSHSRTPSGSVRPEEMRGTRHNMAADLCRRLLTESPQGRTVLVFTSSKRECANLARAIGKWRRENGFSSDEEEAIKSQFRNAVNEMEGVEEAADLREFANNEVYIHNAEITSSVRHVIETIFRESDECSPTRVLIATTTLAYGVNLAVSDVILEHTTFPSSNRTPPAETSILDNVVSEEWIEPVEFHNMAGRAGRMGTNLHGNSARFFVIAPRGIDPVTELLVPYYGTDQNTLRSVLFAREDKSPLRELDDASTNSWLTVPPSHPNTHVGSVSFSYPFSRAILDITRHLCYSNVRRGRSGDNPLKPVTEHDVCDFIGRYSLLRRDSESSDKSAVNVERNKRDAGFLRKAVAAILKDSKELGLLDGATGGAPIGDDENASAGYMIRDIGETMLETGTEFSAVVPLIEMMNLLRHAWDDFFVRSGKEVPRLPAEIYLLALVFQEDVCRRHRRAIPEWRASRNDQVWSDAQKEANESFVLTEFSRALDRILPSIGQDASSLGNRLRRELNVTLCEGLFRPVPRVYEFAPADGGLRFFCAMVRWINGDSFDGCRNVLTKQYNRAGEKQRGQRFVGFADYVSRLSYRARFLAALSLQTPALDRETLLHLERELILVADRLNHGCVSDAVPLFWPRSSNLLRKQAKLLLENGVDASSIAREGVPDSIQTTLGLNDRGNQLVDDISNYSAHELERIWVELKPRDLRDARTLEVVEAIEIWVKSVCEVMSTRSDIMSLPSELAERICCEFSPASRLYARDLSLLLDDTQSDEDDQGPLDKEVHVRLAPISQLDDSDEKESWEGTILRLGSEGSEAGRTIALTSIAEASPTEVGLACEGILRSISSQPTPVTAFCCVIWPWTDSTKFNLQQVAVRTKQHTPVDLFFLTPAAFCALSTFILRGFIFPSRLFEIAAEANGTLITTKILIDDFELLENKDVPGSIRRDLLSLFEVI